MASFFGSKFRTRLVMPTIDSVVIDRIASKCSFNWFSKRICSDIGCDSRETRLQDFFYIRNSFISNSTEIS